ncbi:Prostacyclin synthase [Larimichthys crocea]|uniref:Uncharacterized protein n=1 Tax=Larimichthys crocea TaxID=215358 RepID=A0ACD3RHD7_LARCR|nr:Prostacyclin synthase [Larimichthys crocea]
MIWTIFLLVQAVLLYFLLTDRTRSKTDPPLDKGVIPWLGHALEFGKDASKFLNRMKQKHGDIFTCCWIHTHTTLVINDSDSLDFTRYAQVLMERIFNLQLPHHQPAKAKAMMKKHFLGMNLGTLNNTSSRHLRALLKAEMPQNQKDWKEEGLFNLSYSLLFKAGYLTLFGGEQNNNGTDPSSVYEEYKKFDGLLTKLARGTLKPDSSCKRRGTDEETQKKAVLMQLWASQGNVGPAAFWLLGYLLTNPEALAAVKREMETLETSLLDGPVNTPVFDSALDETLRLTAAPFITREVVQEKTLHMANGQEYLLRKGDRVCLFPFNSPQMDPEIYQEPQKFKYDRFLNDDGSVKRDFYKAGRRLKYYTMPWGAGTNGCVGKQFAINTIRQFVYMLLTNCDLELCDPNAPMPEVNASRYGFGMLQPEGDLLVRYKPKSTL